MISKKGNLVTDNAIGLILAVAVTFVLVMLMISLFSPTFNKGKEGSKSYFGSLKDAISEADHYEKSSFFMLDFGDEGLKFYLVYFGEFLVFTDGKNDFVRSPRDGPLCVCYLQEEKILCDDCLKIKGEITYDKKTDAPWIIKEGEFVNINKIGENYAFTLA